MQREVILSETKKIKKITGRESDVNNFKDFSLIPELMKRLFLFKDKLPPYPGFNDPATYRITFEYTFFEFKPIVYLYYF